MTIEETKVRPLYDIAREIKKDWKNIYFGAVPYLEAMRQLDKVSDSYGYESGRGIILYFLSNASSWHGSVARRVKMELKSMVGMGK